MEYKMYNNILNARATGDRFIPLRSHLDVACANFKIENPEKYRPPANLLEQSPSQTYRQNYAKLLWSPMMKRKSTRILNFTANIGRPTDDKESKKKAIIPERDWNIYPRKKPMLPKYPDNVLFLPEYNSRLDANGVDWSANGYIYTIFGGNVCKWPETNNILVGDKISRTSIPGYQALSCNHSGSRIAVGCKQSSWVPTRIWQLDNEKNLYDIFCCLSRKCTCTVLCWDHSDKLLVTGCSSGYLCVWDKSIQVQKVKGHNFVVTQLCVNADDSLLCSTCEEPCIRVWQFPSMVPELEISTYLPPQAEFHPWQRNILAVGEFYITLWNISQWRKVCEKELDDTQKVSSLTWNPLTAELVVCITEMESQQVSDSVIVLSSLNKVEDYIKEYFTSPVLGTMWSPDGCDFVALDEKERLSFWNFFGYVANTYKKKAAKRLERPKSKLQLGQNIR